LLHFWRLLCKQNSCRVFQGQGRSLAPRSIWGSLAPRLEIKETSCGKLSSNGPFLPSGYQIKWPIPREAKSSPEFHEVSPEMVPPHSFCQILWPMREASAGAKLMAAGSGCVVRKRSADHRENGCRNREAFFLTGKFYPLACSFPRRASRRTSNRKSTFMKSFITILATVLVALTLVAQDKSPADKSAAGKPRSKS